MYSEDMLRIMDEVPPREYGGRIAHKRAWVSEARLEAWLSSRSITEFARKANLSEQMAKSMDAHFASIMKKSKLALPSVKRPKLTQEGKFRRLMENLF